MKTADRSEFATLLDRFASDLVKDQGAIFFHSAPSREDSEIVVAISGWSSQSATTSFLKVTKPFYTRSPCANSDGFRMDSCLIQALRSYSKMRLRMEPS